MTPITDTKPAKKIWRLVDTIPAETRNPYTLIDDTGTHRDMGLSKSRLADFAFEHGADEVSHDYSHIRPGQL